MKELIIRHRELKHEIRALESQMAGTLERFEGTVKDALRQGIVKLNFPAPPGYMRHIIED